MTSAKQIAQVTGLPVSESTIQRELKRNEFHHEKVQISEHLSPMNMEKQLVFAQKYVTENIDFWKKVIFTDKKQWNLQGNDGFISVWTKTKYSYSRITATNLRKGLMVWGAISASGRM